ncbi:MAG: hypothetical protein A3F77_01185 [Betaproteobacteria bacterium RIFCSPLOWO2_12_FULL_67_28]|nr:MAG: hypothetical protein A3F77_01185 [Betaproteobacteria bacterium RIFCSPLOWO2_12_FULL_67_28]
MKRLRLTAIALVAGLLGVALAAPADAHGRRSRAHIGFSIGIPLGWPYWGYPYPYYYPPYQPSVVVVPSEPTVYVERPGGPAAPESAAYWYYCEGAGAYYPYVRECPGGWQHVSPRPPGN